jgi:hypothetical protein
MTTRSGQSIFSRPKPIDISAARRAGFSLDLDIESEDEELDSELARPLVPNPVLFDAGADQRPVVGQQRGPLSEMPRAVQAAHDRDAEDVWAEIGWSWEEPQVTQSLHFTAMFFFW